VLPPGPTGGPLAQTVAFHRDPLAVLRGARERYGDVFTMRLATARPVVVVAAPEEVEALLRADPGSAHAGSARRTILPFASPRSAFGGDGPVHAAAREPIAGLFAPAAVARHGAEMAEIAERHARTWPLRRPFRMLERMRALADEVFVRLVLGVEDDGRICAALRRMLRTPGNPPLTVPGEGDGLMGAVGRRVFDRRHAPLTRLLADEVERRRADPPDDVLGRMLRAAPRQTGEEVADALLVLLAAAQEPAAVALTRLLDRLARDPALAARYLAGDRAAIVRETLRFHPPAVAGLRRLSAPRTIAGHRLPAGVVTMVPIPLLHRDPRAYAEPDAFAPERWAGAPPPAGAYMPFGDGARRCLGEHLAHAYFDALVPAVLRAVRLRAVWPQPERMVLRGTILVPHRSGLALATLR
jgi:cytochrome P450 family 135